MRVFLLFAALVANSDFASFPSTPTGQNMRIVSLEPSTSPIPPVTQETIELSVNSENIGAVSGHETVLPTNFWEGTPYPTIYKHVKNLPITCSNPLAHHMAYQLLVSPLTLPKGDGRILKHRINTLYAWGYIDQALRLAQQGADEIRVHELRFIHYLMKHTPDKALAFAIAQAEDSRSVAWEKRILIAQAFANNSEGLQLGLDLFETKHGNKEKDFVSFMKALVDNTQPVFNTPHVVHHMLTLTKGKLLKSPFPVGLIPWAISHKSFLLLPPKSRIRLIEQALNFITELDLTKVAALYAQALSELPKDDKEFSQRLFFISFFHTKDTLDKLQLLEKAWPHQPYGILRLLVPFVESIDNTEITQPYASMIAQILTIFQKNTHNWQEYHMGPWSLLNLANTQNTDRSIEKLSHSPLFYIAATLVPESATNVLKHSYDTIPSVIYTLSPLSLLLQHALRTHHMAEAYIWCLHILEKHALTHTDWYAFLQMCTHWKLPHYVHKALCHHILNETRH